MKTPTAFATVIVGLLQAPSLIAGPTTATRDNTTLPVTLPAEPEHKSEVTGTVSTVPFLKSVPGPRPELQSTSATRESAAPAAKPAAAPAAQTKAAIPAAGPAISTSPTFDEGSGRRIEEAIQTYSAIASLGGWHQIPAEAKFAIGAAGPYDELLRQRLVLSNDLAPSEASGPYDPELAAGVKRFQIRHGLAATGAMTPRTLSALNAPVEKRIPNTHSTAGRVHISTPELLVGEKRATAIALVLHELATNSVK